MPHCIATSAMEREGEFRINSLALATRSEVMYEVVLRPVNALILRLSCGRVMKNCEANCCKSTSPSLICRIIASVTCLRKVD